MAQGVGTTSNAGVTLKNWTFKKALDAAVNNNIKLQFCEKESVQGKAWSTTAEWVRPNAPSSSVITTITEGSSTTSTNGSVVLTTYGTAMVEYGISVNFSKKLNAASGFDFVMRGKDYLAESIDLKIDDLLRDEMAKGTNGSVTITDRYPYSLGTKTHAGLVSETGAAAMLKLNDIVYAVANLRVNKAKKWNERGYATLMAPEVMADLTLDNQFIEVTKYGDPSRNFKGEAGMVAGTMVFWDTNPFRNNTEDTYAAAGSVYTTMVFGKQAIGISDMTTYRMQPTVNMMFGADKTDLYGQNNVISSTFMAAVAALSGDWMINLRSKTNYA